MANIALSLSTSPGVLSSKIYMADLDSALHYILRVEVGKFSVLEGQRLVALRKFMAVLAQVSGAPASLVRLPSTPASSSLPASFCLVPGPLPALPYLEVQGCGLLRTAESDAGSGLLPSPTADSATLSSGVPGPLLLGAGLWAAGAASGGDLCLPIGNCLPAWSPGPHPSHARPSRPPGSIVCLCGALTA